MTMFSSADPTKSEVKPKLFSSTSTTTNSSAPAANKTAPKTMTSPAYPVPPPLDDPDNPVPTPLPKPDWGGKPGDKSGLVPPTPPTTTPTSPPDPTNPTTPPTTPPPQNVFNPANPLGGLGLDFMRQVTPNELVANQLQGLLQSNSPYMRNAALRGAEYAASRGNINSSIGAGASQRSALEAAMPIAQADAEVYRQANQGNFESLSDLRKLRVTADIQNWMDSESYNREFNGKLAMLPITSAADMLTYITQRALEDPATYTPEVISGFNNFFNLTFNDMMSRLLNPTGGG